MYEFTNGTWLNHLAVRPNGQLVTTLADRPEIYVFDPLAPLDPPLMAHRFTPNTRITAMTEYMPDQFAVMGVMTANDSRSVTYIWNVRLDSVSGPKLAYLCEVPDGDAFVSLAALSSTTLLAASTSGAVHRIDIATGANHALFTDPVMIPSINSVRYRAPYVYFTNTGLGVFARIPVDRVTGEPLGPVETIVSQALGIADVALAPWTDQEGYLVNYEQNTVLKVNSEAKVETVMIGLMAPTAAQFGRTEQDERTLYVVTGAPFGAGRIVSIKFEKT
jgi:hypothetical protein